MTRIQEFRSSRLRFLRLLFSISRRNALAGRRGFSAVEIIAVATVMAILALVLIPIIGDRVEKARLVAAREDLVGLGKAIALAHADTGKYFRLQDYDNSTAYTTTTLPVTLEPWDEVPVTYWETLAYISPENRDILKNRWEGRYIAFTRTTTLRELYDNAAYGWACVRIDPETGGYLDPHPPDNDRQMGPIVIFGYSGIEDPDRRNEYDNTLNDVYKKNTYPTDPWGGPYLFFAPGPLRTAKVQIYSTDYKSPVLYCLGPDGLPGVDPPPAPPRPPLSSGLFLRSSKFLGTGDDIVHEF